MCYHTSQHQPLSIIKKTFNLTVNNEELFQQAYQLNGFTKPYLPVISSSDIKAIDMYRWGLIPFWVKDESSFKANTLNARSEELFEKKRMPLILEGERAEAWVLPDLTKPEMTDLMKPYENDHKLTAYRVLDGVTNSRLDTNVPEVIDPYR